MSFVNCFMLGVDHHQSPIEIREKFSFVKEQALIAQDELLSANLANEVIIVSTCNRTEIYVISEHSIEAVIKWWLSVKSLDESYEKYIQKRFEIDALRHLMRTASGLESIILGEPQILGQIRQSYLKALERSHISAKLSRFFDQALIAAKAIRRGTDIGRCPVSIPFSAAHIAKSHFFEQLNKKEVLIVGAGETAQLVARHIFSLKPKALYIANRNIQKAQLIAEKLNASAFGLDSLGHLINTSDLIISAVDVKDHIITYQMMDTHKLNSRLQLLIDLSMPRSIAPNVNQLKSNTLYGIDCLNTLIDQNKRLRKEASLYAEQLIDETIEDYVDMQKYRKVAHKIKALRQSANTLANDELKKALKRLDNGNDPRLVLTELVYSLKNKWLHHPSVSIKNAAISGREDLLDTAFELFGLDLTENDDDQP